MRSAHGLYLATIAPLVRILVYPPPPPLLEDFTGERRGSDIPYAQPDPLHINQTPLPVYNNRLATTLFRSLKKHMTLDYIYLWGQVICFFKHNDLKHQTMQLDGQ